MKSGKEIRCSLCGEPAATRIAYAKLWLCKKHFIEFIEKRVFESINRYRLAGQGQRMLVAVSGGKDSITMLYLLHKTSMKMGFEVIALHMDLGIGTYSKISREIVEHFCKSLGTPLIILDLKTLIGYSLPELVHKTRRPPCSICGLIKRYLINVVAQEIKADAAALGHHLDDLLPYILKNFMLQNLFEISKLGPKTESVDGFVGRIRPLYDVSEHEIALYAKLSNLPFVDEECPYTSKKSLDKQVKEFLNNLESLHPGIKISFARAVARNIHVYKTLSVAKTLKRCVVCGAPSSDDMCSFCKLTNRVAGRPLGAEVRLKIRDMLSSLGLLK
ncbi:MAG: TIGR00269 family protein [Ignisphaera sp.]